MTADMIDRRLPDALGADRILVPGRCRGDLEAAERDRSACRWCAAPRSSRTCRSSSARARRRPTCREYDISIFAEIVDAPQLSVEEIGQRARALAADGANVIDLGCLPADALPASRGGGRAPQAGRPRGERRFAGHRGAAARRPGRRRLPAEPDQRHPVDRRRGGRHAGADPAEPAARTSLARARDRVLGARGRAFLADPVLEPIHFGFTDSLARYHALRGACPRRRS